MNEQERKAANVIEIETAEETSKLLDLIEQELAELDPVELRQVREHIEYVKWRRDQQNYAEFQENLSKE